MATRPTTTELATQMAALTEQLAALAARVDAQTTPPFAFWERLTLDRHAPAVDTANLTSVLRYHERSTRRGPIIYYALIGVLYVRAAQAIFIDASSIHLLPDPMRLLAVAFYLLVGLGNLGCILFPTRRNQMTMIAPTVAAAAVILLVSGVAAIQSRQVSSLISALIFWIPMIMGHIAWGMTVPGRLDQLAFTRQLLAASIAQEASP